MYDKDVVYVTDKTTPGPYIPDPVLVVKAKILGDKGLLLYDENGWLVAVAHWVKDGTFLLVADEDVAIWAWSYYHPGETLGPRNTFNGRGAPFHLHRGERLQIEVKYD